MTWTNIIEAIGVGFVALMAYGLLCVVVDLISPGDETKSMREQDYEPDYSPGDNDE